MCGVSPDPNEGRLTGIIQGWMYSKVQNKVCAVRIHAQQGPRWPQNVHLFAIDGLQGFPLFSPHARLVCRGITRDITAAAGIAGPCKSPGTTEACSHLSSSAMTACYVHCAVLKLFLGDV